MKNLVRRAGAVAASLALCLTAACSSGSDAPGAQSTLTLGLQENYLSYLLEIALQEGYLADTGITDIETTLFTDLPAMFAAVQKGQINVGLQTIPAVSAFNESTRGDKLQLIQQFGNVTRWYKRSGLDLPDGNEASWHDVVSSWKGLTIGVPAVGSFMDRWLRYMLAEVGLDPERDVNIAVVGVQSSAPALTQGTVDVVGVTSVGAASIEDQGAGEFVLDYPTGPEEFRDILVSVYFTSQSSLAGNREFYEDVAAAMEQARTFVADPANKDACVAILTGAVGLPPTIAEQVYTIDHDGITTTTLDRASYDKTVAAFTTLGLLPTEPVPTWDEFVGIQDL